MMFDHGATTAAAQEAHERVKEEQEENKENEQAKVQESNEVPTKCITNVQTFSVQANVQYMDFEGRSDGESVKKILTMIKPRRLVLVRGPPEATSALREYALSPIGGVTGRVFAPRLLETVDATTESHIYQVKLKDSLVSSLCFATSKDGAELAWVEGAIGEQEEESLLPQAGQEEEEKKNLLVMEEGRQLLPRLEGLAQMAGHESIFVNELKLSDFKQALVRNKEGAEFSGGVLYSSSGKVAVRRKESGRIHLEGTLCPEYFRIRQLLYEQYAIL